MNVLVLGMLPLLFQQSPDLVHASGFVFPMPDGWTRQTDDGTKVTMLVPPGGGDDARVALYPARQQADSTEDRFHEAMLEAVTAQGKVDGYPDRGRKARFLWTRVNLIADGDRTRVTLYTGRSGSTYGAVVFGASAAAFDDHAAAVENLIGELRFEGEEDSAPVATAIHGLDFPVPAGWTREDDPLGAVTLRPRPPRHDLEPRWEYVLVVLPTQPLRGSLWETHRAIFDEVVRTTGLVNTVPPIHEPNAPGPFVYSSTAGDDANGSVRPVRLYSARSEDGIECVVVMNQQDFATTGALFHRATVRKPPKVPRSRIVEAYRRLSQQLDVNVHRGEMLLGSVPYERIILRDDGVADFSPIYQEGYGASRVPAKLDATLRNGRFGSWTAVGESEVHVVRSADKPPEVYVRENGGLRLGDRVYEPMPSVDGLHLDGRWHLPGSEVPRRIEFTAAGRFRDDGVLEDIGFFPVYAWAGTPAEVLQPTPPSRGAGTYEIRDFTILFRYDDGPTWSTDFSISGTDPNDLSKILLRTGALHREP